jgi:hypothetical protein
LQQPDVAVWDCVNLLRAKLAHLLATEKLSSPAGSATGASARTRAPRSRTLPRTLPRSLPALGCCCARLGRLARSLFSHCVSSLLSSLSRASRKRKRTVVPVDPAPHKRGLRRREFVFDPQALA